MFEFLVGAHIAILAIVGTGEEPGDGIDAVEVLLGLALENVEGCGKACTHAYVGSFEFDEFGYVQIDHCDVGLDVIGNDDEFVEATMFGFGFFFQSFGKLGLLPTAMARDLLVGLVRLGFGTRILGDQLLPVGIRDTHCHCSPHTQFVAVANFHTRLLSVQLTAAPRNLALAALTRRNVYDLHLDVPPKQFQGFGTVEDTDNEIEQSFDRVLSSTHHHKTRSHIPATKFIQEVQPNHHTVIG